MLPFLASLTHFTRQRARHPQRARLGMRVEQLEERDLLSIPALPYPDHVVVVVEENHSYAQIIGNPAAPYINALAGIGANFTQSYGLARPSQPNYLHLFSGSNQGVTSNNCVAQPFTTLNLGAALLESGYTFASYAETLPAIGSLACTSGAYARKHNPSTNWQGASAHAVPSSANRRWADFPADYSTLPTVSFVIPNQDNDMHNGSDPARITRGDNWLRTNLDGYVQWAYANNSLLIVTFDEDNGSAGNRIPTLFVGPMVQPGQYDERITHHNVLRTLEDLYSLPYAGASDIAAPITSVWANPWQETDIGAVGAAGGSLLYADYYYAVQGAGAGAGGTADALHYVYQPLHGDGWILAQVTGLDATSAAARAGVMIREDLTAESKQALMARTTTGETQFVTRTTTGGSSTTTDGPTLSIPSYVYLERFGDTVSGWVYNDDAGWVFVGSATLAMGRDVYLGLTVTSGVPGVLGSGYFDTVYLDTGGGGAPGGSGGFGHERKLGAARVDAVGVLGVSQPLLGSVWTQGWEGHRIDGLRIPDHDHDRVLGGRFEYPPAHKGLVPLTPDAPLQEYTWNRPLRVASLPWNLWQVAGTRSVP